MRKSHWNFKLWFDRLLSKSIWRQLGFLALGLVLALGVSYVLLSFSGADWETFCEKRGLNKWLWPIYLLIDSNALNNLYIDDQGINVKGWMLVVSTITFLIGAFVFNGAIIGIITNTIEQRVRCHREGRLHYLKRGHYIVMGYDGMVPSIVKSILERDGEAKVLVLSATEAEGVRERLRRVLGEEEMKRVIVNHGHRTSEDCYREIHLEGAKEVFVVGLRRLPEHDAVNVECLDSIHRYLSRTGVEGRSERITCVFEDLDTYEAFKTTEIFGKISALGIELVPYNYYVGWARRVFVERREGYPAVYGTGLSPAEDPRYVHVVFVGMTVFAEAMATVAAHVLHFPNFGRDPNLRTRITFIDRDADRKKEEFATRNRRFFEVQAYRYRDLGMHPSRMQAGETPAHPNAGGTPALQDGPALRRTERMCFEGKEADFLDVEFDFLKGDIFAKSLQEEIGRWAEEHGERQYLSIFLTAENQRDNFACGMNMPEGVYGKRVPVFVRQDRSDNFVSNLRTADAEGRYAHLYAFGMEESAYSDEGPWLRRAKLINYLYATMDTETMKFRDEAWFDAMGREELTRRADEEWRKLSTALKWSNLYNAYSLRVKEDVFAGGTPALQGAGETPAHPLVGGTPTDIEDLARVEHNRWNVERLLLGFRKGRQGEAKGRYVHPDIRPYDELGAVRELDREFSRRIPWILNF